jgi:hypothetical protein
LTTLPVDVRQTELVPAALALALVVDCALALVARMAPIATTEHTS